MDPKYLIYSQKEIESINKKIDSESTSVSIDVSLLTQQKCSLGSDGWFFDGSVGYHKAIKVDSKIKQVVLSPNTATFIGFLTA